MHKAFKACLYDERDAMHDAGINVDDSTLEYYENIYQSGDYPCPACFLRRNKNIAMTPLKKDGQHRAGEHFQCPDCFEYIEVSNS